MSRHYDWEMIAKLTLEGKTAREISELIGCTKRTVSRARVATGTAQIVSEFASRPITDERLEQIRFMVEDGAPVSEIEKTLRTTYTTVNKYFPGSSWNREEISAHVANIQRARWAVS